MDRLNEQFSAAKKAGDKASAKRLERIIFNIKRNERHRHDREQQRRQAPLNTTSQKDLLDDHRKEPNIGFFLALKRDVQREEAERARHEEERLKKEKAEQERLAELRKKVDEERRRHEREVSRRAQRAEETRQRNDERKKKIFEDQESRRKNPPPPPPLPPPQPKPKQTVPQWRAAVDKCFENYSTIETFPAPPVLCCNKPHCQSRRKLCAIEACDCNIRIAFRAVRGLRLKVERLKWHPDRFAACTEEKREEFQKMAHEVFVVVDQMYQETRP